VKFVSKPVAKVSVVPVTAKVLVNSVEVRCKIFPFVPNDKLPLPSVLMT